MESLPFTETDKNKQGAGTGLTGTGEHGSSVLFRHAKFEAILTLNSTSVKVGERSAYR